MALSGNLGFVPLDEVLRLLMRSDQRGSVEVRGEDIRGRVFVARKGIALATTAEDRDLHKHLVNSGYVDDAFLRRVASGEATFADLHDREATVIDLLREITIESLYHLSDKGTTFEVVEGATIPYGSPRPFELEAVLDDARRRADEWETVHEAIADLDSTIKMDRGAGDQEEIRLNREAWRLLCEIGGGASVAAIAERLGTTEFWIAKVAAEMAERKLLVFSDDWSAEAATEPAPAPVSTDEQLRPNDSWWVDPDEQPAEEMSDESPGQSEEQAPVAESKESRFGSFVHSARTESAFAGEDEEPGLAPAAEAEDVEAPAEPGFTVDSPSFQAETAQGEDVGEDTEAFLEKVFSQLDSNGKADVEEEGHGLLRRRRMGSVLKEIDED